METSTEKLDVRLEAVGFQFLRYNFKNKTVDIELSKVQEQGGAYFIAPDHYQEQIEKQLSNSMRLVQMAKDTLFFDFQKVITKELSVEPTIEMDFAQNYILDGLVKVEPPFVSVTGPVEEINHISSLKTYKIELNDLNSDFSKTIFFVKPDSLYNVSFSTEKVTVSGRVARFSEKIIEVPIEVLNLPEHVTIKTFPDEIKVLCKAKVEDLNKIQTNEFKVTADFNLVEGKNNILSLYLQQIPEGVFSAALVQNKVEYILKNK